MSEVKFRADLLCEVNQMPGHIILSDTTFVWKPMKWYPHIGHIEKFECPIEDIIGYSKKNFSIWSKIYLEFATYNNVEGFWAPSAKSIIYELRLRNPSIREF